MDSNGEMLPMNRIYDELNKVNIFKKKRSIRKRKYLSHGNVDRTAKCMLLIDEYHSFI